MSSLLLVRHGQASAYGPDYDVLSPLGADQSRLLGERWAKEKAAGGPPIHAAYMGPLRRHRETWTAIAEGAEAEGLALPAPEVIDDLSEIDVSHLLTEAVQRVLPSCPNLLEQQASGTLDAEAKTARKHVMGIFAKMLERWAGGETFADVESYEDFMARARRGLSTIMRAQGRAKRVAVITSGGPICVALTTALSLAPPKAAEMMLVTINASVTELLYTEERLTLRGYNDHAHLPPKLITRI